MKLGIAFLIGSCGLFLSGVSEASDLSGQNAKPMFQVAQVLQHRTTDGHRDRHDDRRERHDDRRDHHDRDHRDRGHHDRGHHDRDRHHRDEHHDRHHDRHAHHDYSYQEHHHGKKHRSHREQIIFRSNHHGDCIKITKGRKYERHVEVPRYHCR